MVAGARHRARGARKNQNYKNLGPCTVSLSNGRWTFYLFVEGEPVVPKLDRKKKGMNEVTDLFRGD